ncbi:MULTISPECIES: amino acid ABC transporter ATP-binding protein [unclassified Clostridium]|uniref:amino acid ABC transporter ATP-binding protein n=1 Tax=unclassified Clostridium TaxID=2614128 RepID=UPI0025D57341|nr:amino acid ABC transporter ATP-binding protein [Clostridium sp.]MCI6692230.1 amino acid ABC transporter ATP-binding protein [Clostridium sp.]MDY2631007.1 amino acid ABC transporter ATP-binding protein [Clostridium sp.]MDY6228877.1 amino acid ABC transporter ATP-binding protein [Clostridium sp.]
MLRIEGLKKQFGNSEVLKGIDLEVNSGEVVVIVGPSGGGKTTLLRCINGLEYCDNGTIEIDKKYLCKNGVYEEKNKFNEARREIGLVFQNFNLFPHMSVLENLIEAPKKVLGQSEEVAVKNAKEILNFLGLGDKISSYPYQLSGGQKQRVAIGRALALNPKLMCFDEPTSALDPGLTGEVSELIRSLAKDGMSMLIITHDMSFAEKVADKIYSMNNGVLTSGNFYNERIKNDN